MFQNRKDNKQKQSTRDLLHIDGISEIALQTPHGDLVFFFVKPTNLSVLSSVSVQSRIHALMTVLKGLAELEMLCVNSRENFEDNKAYLRARVQQENIPAIRLLLEQDQTHLDQIQMQTATAREFYLVIRMQDEPSGEVLSYLHRIEKSIREQGFSAHRAGKEEIKRLLAVYYEQNVTSEQFEDIDGQRWLLPEEFFKK